MHGNYQNRPNYVRNEAPKASPAPVEETTQMTADTEVPVTPGTNAVENQTTEKTEVAGVVTGCTRLNVRRKPSPNSNVVTTIAGNSEVMIDLKNSTNEFYKVCNAAGIEGFCMKKYIEIRP